MMTFPELCNAARDFEDFLDCNDRELFLRTRHGRVLAIWEATDDESYWRVARTIKGTLRRRTFIPCYPPHAKNSALLKHLPDMLNAF